MLLDANGRVGELLLLLLHAAACDGCGLHRLARQLDVGQERAAEVREATHARYVTDLFAHQVLELVHSVRHLVAWHVLAAVAAIDTLYRKNATK